MNKTKLFIECPNNHHGDYICRYGPGYGGRGNMNGNSETAENKDEL